MYSNNLNRLWQCSNEKLNIYTNIMLYIHIYVTYISIYLFNDCYKSEAYANIPLFRYITYKNSVCVRSFYVSLYYWICLQELESYPESTRLNSETGLLNDYVHFVNTSLKAPLDSFLLPLSYTLQLSTMVESTCIASRSVLDTTGIQKYKS